MGEEDENSSEERVEKKYCCGNCPQREALYISKLDLGVAVYELVFVVTFSIIYFIIPDYFQNYTLKNPQQKQLKEFLALSQTLKFAILLLNVVIPVFSLLLAVLLLVAAKSKNIPRLKKWFNLTIIKTIPALALDVYFCVTFFDDKMFIVSFVLFCYLYRLYSLWIVIELKKEIKHVDTDFIHPMYRDTLP